MNVLIWIFVALFSYFVAAINPAILLSKMIYHQDIRNCGSGNAGFTNFKRTFGNKYAWFVFALDILKTILIGVVSSVLFGQILGMRQIGVAYACALGMFGHAFPVFYEFKGGKGFLVCMTMLWFLDWRAGLLSTVLFVILLLTTKYMSFSTILSLLIGSVSLFFLSAEYISAIIYLLCTVFMLYRHKENLKRLSNGTESKFSLGSKSHTQQE